MKNVEGKIIEHGFATVEIKQESNFVQITAKTHTHLLKSGPGHHILKVQEDEVLDTNWVLKRLEEDVLFHYGMPNLTYTFSEELLSFWQVDMKALNGYAVVRYTNRNNSAVVYYLFYQLTGRTWTKVELSKKFQSIHPYFYREAVEQKERDNYSPKKPDLGRLEEHLLLHDAAPYVSYTFSKELLRFWDVEMREKDGYAMVRYTNRQDKNNNYYEFYRLIKESWFVVSPSEIFQSIDASFYKEAMEQGVECNKLIYSAEK